MKIKYLSFIQRFDPAIIIQIEIPLKTRGIFAGVKEFMIKFCWNQ